MPLLRLLTVLQSIELTVEKNVLSVSATRQWSDDGVETVIWERPQGTITRQWFLGEALDTNKVAATCTDGVLRITIPVAEAAKARRIQVAGAGEPRSIEATSA